MQQKKVRHLSILLLILSLSTSCGKPQSAKASTCKTKIVEKIVEVPVEVEVLVEKIVEKEVLVEVMKEIEVEVGDLEYFVIKACDDKYESESKSDKCFDRIMRMFL
jgi:hypothetical protein